MNGYRDVLCDLTAYLSSLTFPKRLTVLADTQTYLWSSFYGHVHRSLNLQRTESAKQAVLEWSWHVMVLQVLLGEQLSEQARRHQLSRAIPPLVRARQAARLCYLRPLHKFAVTRHGKPMLCRILKCPMTIFFQFDSLAWSLQNKLRSGM